jgi:hypothetical protein
MDEQLLARLDRIIKKHHLHTSYPVDLDSVLEAYHVEFHPLPEAIDGVAIRWRKYGRQFGQITLNPQLKEPENSARLREAQTHEYTHLYCKHSGDLFILWRPGSQMERFTRYLNEYQERQCRYVSAYLLVPIQALRDMAGMEPWYIARHLDVPEELVHLRWEIYQKYGR